MRRSNTTWIVLFASASIMCAPVALAQSSGDRLKVEAFIVSSRPLVITDLASACCAVTAYRLDGLSSLTASLNANLPANPVLAEQVVKQAFKEHQRDLESAARDHATALEKAISYGLTRYPALVFNDGESVIYGVTDLDVALAIYRRAQ